MQLAPFEQKTATGPAGGEELRLALAMRGGVSLAVWVGGACAEINALRQAAAPGAPASPYLRICSLAGYRGVTVDVMAGASAGGINAVLLAASIVSGASFDATRDVWLDLAQLDDLMRPLGGPRPPSPLQGDERMLRPLVDRVTEMLQGRAARPDARVDVHLAATTLRPRVIRRHEPSGFDVAEPRHDAVFHFQKDDADGGWRSDFGPSLFDPTLTMASAAARLGLAARATASFPGAFEPALVESRRTAEFGGPAAPSNLCRNFSVSGEADGGWFEVLDGGILDNIPIARAVRAIPDMSADTPTERWLLYLHPSPPDVASPPASTSASGRGPRPRTGMVGALRATVKARAGEDSLIDDLDALDAHNEDAVRFALLVDAAFATATPGVPVSVAAVAEYRAARARVAAARVFDLLRDPVDALGGDPFTRDAHTDPTAGWTARQRGVLADALRDALADRDPSLDVVDGLEPVQRVAELLIDWCRKLEAGASSEDRVALGRLKARSYRIRRLARLLLRHSDAMWPIAAAETPPDGETLAAVSAWARTVRDTARSAAVAFDPEDPDDAAATLLAALQADDVDAVARSTETLRKSVARRLASLSHPTVAGDVARELKAQLVAARRAIAVIASSLPVAGPIDAYLREHPDDPTVVDGAELLLLPLVVSGTGRADLIRFHRLSGLAETPMADWFEQLRGPDGRVRVKDKLAGNELANFAAFYKRTWRANDWMWGRLDAASGLVQLLIRPERLRATWADPDELCAAVRAAVTDGVAPGWSEAVMAAWHKLEPTVVEECNGVFDRAVATTELAATRDALVTRLQCDVLAAELPVVLAGGHAGSPMTADEARAALRTYAVGRETITDDLRGSRPWRLVKQLALVVWRGTNHDLPLGPVRPVAEPMIRASVPVARLVYWFKHRRSRPRT